MITQSKLPVLINYKEYAFNLCYRVNKYINILIIYYHFGSRNFFIKSKTL